MSRDSGDLYLEELLRQAEAINEQARQFERTKINHIPVKKESDSGQDNQDRAPQVEGADFAGNQKYKNRLDGEIGEIISDYSTKDKTEKPFTNTQGLRDSLAAGIQENKELLGYYEGTKVRSTESKVDELYALIQDARAKTQSDVEKSPPEAITTNRLVESDTLPEKDPYTQEKMFSFGDTLIIEDTPTIKSKAEFDSDYAGLSEKIASGEITFDSDEDEKQISFLQDETDKLAIVDENGEPLDETDINLRIAFEMMDESEIDIDEFIKRETEKAKRSRKQKIQEEKEYEYTSREQNAEVNAMLRKGIRTGFFKLAAIVLVALAVLYLEISYKSSPLHSDYLQPGGRSGILYILIDLQLLFLAGLIMGKNVKDGISGILKKQLNPNSLFTTSLILTALYTVTMIFIDPASPDLKLYSLPSVVAGLCIVLVEYLTSKKDYHCFRVLASKRTKYAAVLLESNAREADEFYKYLIEDSDLYTVQKAKFVTGFFERIRKRPKSEDIFNFLVPVLFGAGVILFGLVMILTGSFADSARAFGLLIAASVPLASFFMIPLPVIAANKKGAKNNSAFIGNGVTEEYADASVLSFVDTEVYPSHLVKITSFKTYGDYRIDKIIPELAKVFDYVGGPLQKVFSGAMSGKVSDPGFIRLIESAEDGICVAMDGTHVFLGKKSYIERYRFETPTDPDDYSFERNVGSIMYVVMNESIASKIYLKYSPNPLFDSLLKDMYKAGMCVGIKTLDPNINNEILTRSIKFKKCPIAILKAADTEDLHGEHEEINSGIVSGSSLHTFLRMFVLCDKARHITKSNAIITLAGLFLSFFATFFLAITGDVGIINSYYLVAVQLIWLLPVWLTSYLL